MVRSVFEKVDDDEDRIGTNHSGAEARSLSIIFSVFRCLCGLPFSDATGKSGMNEQTNILSGLRVIDCGTYIAGPSAATIMSDFGAEVIKIERPPYGDPYRRLSFLPGMAVSE